MRRVTFWQLFIKKDSPYIKNLDQIILIQIFLFLNFQIGMFSSQMGDFTFNAKIVLNQGLEF